MKILKKNKSRILGVLLSCVMTLSLLVGIGTVDTNAAPVSGKCGENVVWSYSDGTLTISGEGAMTDFDIYSEPWRDYMLSIESVEISSGVTSIGDYAFSEYTNLKTATMPSTLKSIGENAFYSTGLELADIPEGVEVIKMNSFLSSAVTKVIIPSTVNTIGFQAFSQCNNLNLVIVRGSNPANLMNHATISSNRVFASSKFVKNKVVGIQVPRDDEILGNYTTKWSDWSEYIGTHAHDWTYKANGNKIKAYCSNTEIIDGDCQYQGEGNALKLTLNAENMDYSGSSFKVDIEENITAITKDKLVYLYQGREGTSYNKDYAPRNVGKYTVNVSIGGATATADFEITKINPTYTAPTTNDITYNGSNQELITKGLSKNGTMKYSLDQTNWSTDIPTGKDAGNYTVYYKVFGTGNYGDSSVESVTAKINPKAVTVTPDDVSKSYSDEDPKLTYKVTGLIDGESLKDITLTRKKGEEVGEYAITASQKEGSNSNYAITFNDGKLTINQKNIKNDENIEVKLGDTLIYDGKEQVQKIESVKINGKDVTYTVTGNKATEPGIYEMTIKGTGSYTGEFKFKYAVVSLDDTKTDNTFSGNIKTEVKRDDHAPKTELKTTKSEMIQLLASADELSKVANGDALNIWLEVRDASDLISDTSKQQIAQKIEGYQIGQYIDISLFKQLRSASASTQITDTQKPIIIDVVITEDLLNNNTSIKRTYYIVRNHEGTVEILETTQNGNTLTFSTNQFSDYAIVYKDVQTNVATKGNKQTGDSTHISLYAMTLFSSFIGLAVLGFLKRKDMIER